MVQKLKKAKMVILNRISLLWCIHEFRFNASPRATNTHKEGATHKQRNHRSRPHKVYVVITSSRFDSMHAKR